MWIKINGEKRSLNRIILLILFVLCCINLYLIGDNKKVYAVYDIGTKTYCDYTSGDWSFRQVPIEDVPQEILSKGLPPKTEYLKFR